ncbi:DUF6056 family protein [Streptomyces sp. BI20]|uniref:DUF6056 family protein n=1 Tax=Streptomyces sp. BI20 TaxID=3403460 RepID=UPI003C751967
MTPETLPPRLRGPLRIAAAAIAVAAAALVAVGCFLALYVRPTSDDWCAAWKARDMGVLGIVGDFYTTQNGRVTNAFLSGIIYADGITGPKVLPTVIALSLGAGLVLLARAGLRSTGLRAPLAVLVAGSAVIVALFCFAGTRVYQALLWAPATISHTLPAVIGVWAVLVGVWGARSPRPGVRRTALAVTALLAFGIGTLSEPFTIVGGLILGTAGLLALPRVGLARTWWPFTWAAVWCVTSLIGLAVLYTSPGARWRRSVQPPADSMFSGEALGKSWDDWLRIWGTIWGQPAYLGALAVGLLIGLALTRLPRAEAAAEADSGAGADRPGTGPRALVILLPVPVLALGSFVVAMALNSSYGPNGWTFARTWNNFLVPFLMALCLYGVLLGRLLARRLPRAVDGVRPRILPLALAGGLVTALTLLSVAALVQPVRDLTTATVSRSLTWDRQDERIRALAARGERDVEYRPSYIGGLAEPYFTKNEAKDWVAQCVAEYYGVDRVHKPAE